MSARQRRQLDLRIHPATKTFQALRIMVNDEFGELDAILRVAATSRRGGRLAIIASTPSKTAG